MKKKCIRIKTEQNRNLIPDRNLSAETIPTQNPGLAQLSPSLFQIMLPYKKSLILLITKIGRSAKQQIMLFNTDIHETINFRN